MKKQSKNKNTKHGFSIIEFTIASAFVVVAGMSVLKVSRHQTKIEEKTALNPAVRIFNMQLIQGVQTLLGSTKIKRKDSEGNDIVRSEAGICRMISSPATTHGVSRIRIKLFSKNNDDSPFDEKAASRGAGRIDNWENNFPGWSLAENIPGFCEANNYTKCFSQRAGRVSGGTDKVAEKLQNLAKVELIPVHLNPYQGGEIFEPVKLENAVEMDVKDVGFIVRSSVRFTFKENKKGKGKGKGKAKGQDKGNKPDSLPENASDQAKANVEQAEGYSRVAVEERFVWAGDIAFCDKELDNGKVLRLAPSGTGMGDPEGRMVHNLNAFHIDERPPIDIYFEKAQIRTGKKEANSYGGQSLVSDSSTLLANACNEEVFTCADASPSKRVYSRIASSVGMNYIYPNGLTASSSIKLALSMNVEKKTKGGNDAGNVSLSGTNFHYYLNGKKVDPNNINLSGAHSLEILANDSDNAYSANNLCRKICTREGINKQQLHRAVLDFKFPQYQGKKNAVGSLRDEFDFGCTACHTKSCARIGLGTFGPMEDIPKEALDNMIPECAAASAQAQDIDPVPSEQVAGAGQAGNTCIAAELVGSNDIRYIAMPCTERYPVVCFNYGQFLLAKRVTREDAKIPEVRYKEAMDVCFETGREIVPTGNIDRAISEQGEYPSSGLRDFPREEITKPETEGGGTESYYNFVNIAKQGMFFSIQDQKQKEQFLKHLAEIGTDEKRFWVGLRKDEGNQIIAQIPFAQTVTREDEEDFDERFAFFYSDLGRFKAVTFPYRLPANYSGGTKGLLLYNDIKTKGAVAVNPNSPYQGHSVGQGFRFLCRKKESPYRFFASEGRGRTQGEGPQVCQSEQGHFLPPTTMLGWAQSILLSRDNHKSFPFPDPIFTADRSTAVDNLEPLWVAMSGNDRSGDSWKLFPSPQVRDILSEELGVKAEEEEDEASEAAESVFGSLGEGENIADSPKVDRRGRLVPSSNTATHIVCLDKDSGRFRSRPVSSTCNSIGRGVNKDDLKGERNILNKIRWILMKKDLPSDAIVKLSDEEVEYEAPATNEIDPGDVINDVDNTVNEVSVPANVPSTN